MANQSKIKVVILKKRKNSPEMLAALERLKNREMSLREASETYQVNYFTLRKKFFQLKEGILDQNSRKCFFTSKEEMAMAQHLYLLAKMKIPFGLNDIRVIAYELIKLKYPNREQYSIPSEKWARSFIKRQSKLVCLKKSRNISKVRAEISENELKEYHDNLVEEMTKDGGVEPGNVLQFDESGFKDEVGRQTLIF